MGELTPPDIPERGEGRISKSDAPPQHQYTPEEKRAMWLKVIIFAGGGLAIVVVLSLLDII